MGLNGWHPGERSIRTRLQMPPNTDVAYTWIAGEMSEQHFIFHTSNLHFLPFVTLDATGRPWGGILTGEKGLPGFIKLSERTPESLLKVSAKPWIGDPLAENLKSSSKDRILAAGIGVEWSTRRRNKLAGYIKAETVSWRKDGKVDFDLVVNEAIGNCPKYITIRKLESHPDTAPHVKYKEDNVAEGHRLPDELVELITQADTVFFGTSYHASEEDAARLPSHLGMNQRGGRPGFVRVSPLDGRTVYLPDFSGNRIMTSLGNVEASKQASLTFVSWLTGDVLYITGDALNLVGEEARNVMPRQNCLTEVKVTGYRFVANAMPCRQKQEIKHEPSPYSPPVKFLAAEKPAGTSMGAATKVTLRSIVVHSPNLATFTWETSEPFKQIQAGQAAVLDFSELFGEKMYQHMNAANPTAVNDDRIRTWTVSSWSTEPTSSTFDLTIREKPGGLVTGALFSIVRRVLDAGRPQLLEDARPLNFEISMIGFSGDFVLPAEDAASLTTRSLLWLAGGIGITPFVAMLRNLSGIVSQQQWNIQLVLSTREPDVLLDLLNKAVGTVLPHTVKLQVDIFSNLAPTTNTPFLVKSHIGRFAASTFLNKDIVEGRQVYMCGPPDFENDSFEALSALGVPKDAVHREGFAY
ncbi:hypothetical protein BKA62DRAFT_657195 [Auriculariales sp. MPI-PUGE-AT-0066]|nr:hypothetical protein BKA62DRAFT_657195 [Auriculariales sp. MPI-PUGE-AT-0066]